MSRWIQVSLHLILSQSPELLLTMFHQDLEDLMQGDNLMQVQVQLEELVLDRNQDLLWRPTSRWIQEEQEDPRGATRISSLAFRSLLELRETISEGAVLLDLRTSGLRGIVQQVADQMVSSQQVRPEDHSKLLRVLLLPHSQPDDDENLSTSSSRTITCSGPAAMTGGRPVQSGPSWSHREAEGAEPVEFRSAGGAKHTEIPERAEALLVLLGGVSFLDQPSAAFVRLQESLLLDSVFELQVPVRFLFVLLAPPSANMDFPLIGRCFSTLMSDQSFLWSAYQAEDHQDVLVAINRFLDVCEVLPSSEEGAEEPPRHVSAFQQELLEKQSCAQQDEDSLVPSKLSDEPLRRSGRLFGGLIRDVTRRYPQYPSDIRDALNPQCMAAVIFIYFAALSPAITFGGLLGEKTGGLIGVSELIVATATQGVIFSLLGAQPLLVIGFSGPLLVFEEAFYTFCSTAGVEYLTGRVWVGVWLVLIVMVTVALEGSILVRFVSRFTQEIFSFLISLIFIYETFVKLVRIFQEHPLRNCYRGNGSAAPPPCNSSAASGVRRAGQPDTALLSLLLMAGTFSIACYLRKFKNSSFFPGRLRRTIGDFGVPIAILVMVLLDYGVEDTFTQKLSVPSGFSVSSPEKRGWLVSPLGSDGRFPAWMMAASVLPAVLVFILIFMESQITALIVSKKERLLVKGTGFHLDLLLIVAAGGVSALFGLPWLSAATVRSVTHTNALTVTGHARVQEVKEQRVTGFLVALLVGLSMVIGEVLRQIPLAVLFGVFLYMGVMSLNGIQLTERLVLLLMPSKYHPAHGFVRKVRTSRMHLFTLVQLSCLSLLWVVMATAAALAFPLVLLLTIPLRKLLLPLVFSEAELQMLDADDTASHPEEKEGRDRPA